jgi:tetratricopeptide (TPR) repeat protein
MPSVNRAKPKRIAEAVRFMLEHGKTTEALRILQPAVDDVRQTRDWEALREIWTTPLDKKTLQVQPELWTQTPWRIAIGRILAGCSAEKDLESWLATCQASTGTLEPELRVLQAFVLICQDRFAEIQTLLRPLLPALCASWSGLAHQRLLWAAHRLHEPWDTHLLEVRQQLHGRALGLALLDAATCAYSEHHDELGQRLAQEALTHLKGDAFHLAWTNLHIGLHLLQRCDFSAEHYFAKSLLETTKSTGKRLRPKALAAMAALRRVQGEWRMALELYRRAEKAALLLEDVSERFQIVLNTARTHRLSGHPRVAVRLLEDALQGTPKHQSEFWLELAAAHAQCASPELARAALANVGRVQGGDVHLKTIIEAELMRCDGAEGMAAQALMPLPMTTRVVREEAMRFYALFQCLPVESGQPEPLRYPKITVVRVFKVQPVQVWINDRLLPDFADTQDVTALLRLLQTPKTPVKTDDLATAIFALEDLDELETAFRDLTNKIVSRLRHKLGYPESVRNDRKCYWLDPDTVWRIEKT